MLSKATNAMEPSTKPKAYTISQFARACNADARRIRRVLGNVPCDQTIQVSGNVVRAWRICSLPVEWQQCLESAAERKGYRNAEHLLADPAVPLIEDAPAVEAPADRFFEIRQAISGGEMSEAEQLRVLRLTIEKYDALIELGESQRVVKREILDLLWSCRPGLAPSRNALRVFFDRKYERWTQKGQKPAALEDGRTEENRNRAKPLPEEDRDLVIAHAVIGCGGRVSQAWRECIEHRVLSEATVSRFLSNPSDKSHVPHCIREAVRFEVAMLEANHHGPRGTKDNGAYIDRYWGCVPSMAWYCMDDATLPIYWYVPNGKGWFTLLRGQFLLAIDDRSTCILGYALMPERNYNARVIRTLITKICDEYGLPRTGFHFEGGIWKNSKILKGEKDEIPIEYEEVEQGLLAFGLRFHHSIRARSKPIERVIGALQNFMEGDPGYAGRNERLDDFEEFQRLKLAVETKRLDPRQKFYNAEQWDARLAELCKRYNSEEQQGKHMTGLRLSPEDAMEKFKEHDDRPVKFDPRCRWLFANHKRPIKVTKNGITLKFGGEFFNYRNEQTGKLRGQMVLAWFDPELPEVLSVTDMNRENAFCLSRSPQVSAMDAPEEILALAMQGVEQHMGHARTRYRIIQAKHNQRFRQNIVSASVLETGRQIEGGRAAALAQQSETRTLQMRGARAFREAGIPMPNLAKLRPEQVEGAERLSKLLADDDE